MAVASPQGVGFSWSDGLPVNSQHAVGHGVERASDDGAVVHAEDSHSWASRLRLPETLHLREIIMGQEDVGAGQAKQIRGKPNQLLHNWHAKAIEALTNLRCFGSVAWRERR